jgi:hypothetical protein
LSAAIAQWRMNRYWKKRPELNPAETRDAAEIAC